MIFLICLAALTISGDLFFVFHLGGFTFRAYQLLLIPVLLKGLLDLYKGVWPVGFGKLLWWTFLIVIFIPNTTLMDRSLLYAGWLVFSVLMVLGITAVIDTRSKFQTLLRWYLYSFEFSALFGLSQFVMAYLGMTPYLVEQWWGDGLPRVNGFTYEPSYYATYMITGWVMVDYLRYRKVDMPQLNLAFVLMTAAMLVCTSRAGYAVMILWLGLRTFWYLREGAMTWRKPALVAVIGLSVVMATGWVGGHLDQFAYYAGGLGVAEETGSYSVDERQNLTVETLAIFVNHPVIGVSLGGIAPAISEQNGIALTDNADAKTSEGLCTTAEVLAASGIVGFIFYVLYMAKLCRTMFEPRNEAAVGKALGWGFIFLLVMLQFDQNILRGYLWLHIAIMSAACRVWSMPLSDQLSPGTLAVPQVASAQ
jgi:hypothetical protein